MSAGPALSGVEGHARTDVEGPRPLLDGRARVRADLFHHLAGVVLAPTVKALADRGVLQLLLDAGERVTLDSLTRATQANAGYLRVALRLLASAGWLNETFVGAYGYTVSELGTTALRIAPAQYEQVVSFLPHAPRLQQALVNGPDADVLPLLRELVQRAGQRWGIEIEDGPGRTELADQLRRHLDGVVIAPAMVALARARVLPKLLQGPIDIDAIEHRSVSLGCVFDLLAAVGWATRDGRTIALTEPGRYAASLAASYGVTVSYVPTLLRLPELLFGNPRVERVDANGNELLVDRAMNVWGSGGAHATYFKALDEIVVDIFNRPLAEQPAGICDMGCGDGTLLAHLYRLVQERTARGRVLREHPLVIVGADYNKVARRAASRTLRLGKIPAFLVVTGDINRPASLAGELEKRGIDSHDLLHVRSFLDHNRPYTWLGAAARGSRRGDSTGAFVYRGALLGAAEMEENLVRHLRRWKPYIGRFGLLVLELHTLPPAVTAAHLDRTPAIAYDGTHGYSDQYLVEAPVFLRCAREAGLTADARFSSAFPASELGTVTINFFTASVSPEA